MKTIHLDGKPLRICSVGRSDSQPDTPPMVEWLPKAQRRNPTSNGFSHIALKPEFRESLATILRDGYEIVRIHWVTKHGGNQFRYAIQFNSERDLVIFRMFWM